jgi:hypothetical protein
VSSFNNNKKQQDEHVSKIATLPRPSSILGLLLTLTEISKTPFCIFDESQSVVKEKGDQCEFINSLIAVTAKRSYRQSIVLTSKAHVVDRINHRGQVHIEEYGG